MFGIDDALIAAGISSIPGIFGMFNRHKGPAEGMEGDYDEMIRRLSEMMGPYMNEGKGADERLRGEYEGNLGYSGKIKSAIDQMLGLGGDVTGKYKEMSDNPNAITNRIGEGYKESPGYKWQLGQELGAADRAASAGGMLGSPEHQQRAQTIAQGLSSEDYNNYLNRGLNIYTHGLEGEKGLYNQGFGGAENKYEQGLSGEEGISNRGYNANTDLMNKIKDLLEQKEGIKFGNREFGRQSFGQGVGSVAETFGDYFKNKKLYEELGNFLKNRM